MAQISSTMLGEMINEELDAQMHVNPVDFASSIESSSLEYGPNWHNLNQFHVQFHSKMLHDHESINRKCSCVKNLKNILREKIWWFLNLDLKMSVNAENSWDYPYIPHANDAENLF